MAGKASASLLLMYRRRALAVAAIRVLNRMPSPFPPRVMIPGLAAGPPMTNHVPRPPATMKAFGGKEKVGFVGRPSTTLGFS
jgi:hypothetical protein